MTGEQLIRWTMTVKTRSAILAALAEAADAKRDLIDVCPEDHTHGCGTCEYRARAAAEYESVAAIVSATYEKDADSEDTGVWRDGYEAGARDEAASCFPRPDDGREAGA